MMILILIAIVVLFIVAGLYNPLNITEYVVASGKIEAELKMVLLTDLHSCSYGEAQNQLIEAIDSQKPDIILMAGDIADDALPDDKTKELLAGIADKYPCYYVAGNHEFRNNRVEERKEMFRSYGVHVLEGTWKTVVLQGQTISIRGVDDPDVGKTNFENQLTAVAESIEKGQYTILLSHRPELFMDYAKYDFDLVVSGHAHGGQWALPLILPNGLFSPQQGLFPRYTRGVHTNNGTAMVVSRGLAKESTIVPRFFNRPEVVVITLVPE